MVQAGWDRIAGGPARFRPGDAVVKPDKPDDWPRQVRSSVVRSSVPATLVTVGARPSSSLSDSAVAGCPAGPKAGGGDGRRRQSRRLLMS